MDGYNVYARLFALETTICHCGAERRKKIVCEKLRKKREKQNIRKMIKKSKTDVPTKIIQKSAEQRISALCYMVTLWKIEIYYV